MATITDSVEQTGAPRVSAARTRALDGVRFDTTLILIASWLVAGVFLDGWAHTHLSTLDTFFTPWHAVLYSGALATALFLGAVLVANHARGYAWGQALPAGYNLSLLGMGIFALAGAGDLAWHTLFGIERAFAVLLSPTHLGLALGVGLIVSGPARAAWARPVITRPAGWPARLPLVVSLAYVMSTFTFMLEYAYPLVVPYPLSFAGGSANQELGVLGILVTTAAQMGVVLFALRRSSLPPGGLLLIFTLNAALMGVLGRTYSLVLVALLGGLAAEALRAALRPGPARPGAFRLFAFTVPLVYYTVYFLALQTQGSLSWPFPVVAGAVVEAGAAGWLLSLLVLPVREA